MSAFGGDERPTQESSRGSPAANLDDKLTATQAERDLLVGVLETLSRSRHVGEYLEQLVEHMKDYSGCRCLGIRLLDDKGNIPYISYSGFSRAFYESESPLSVESDKCMCINVIKGDADPELPFYTDGGSFLSNGTTKLLASVSEDTKGQTRNVCNAYGYESVALVPMRYKDRILGLIHLADENEDKIPIEKVQFLERVGTYIGEALHRFMVEEELAGALKDDRDLLQVIMDETDAQLAYLDPEFNFVRVNSAYADGSGHTTGELIGQNHFDLFPNEENQAIFEMVRDTGKPVEFQAKPFEYQDQPWRGVTYWDWTLVPVKDVSGHVQGLVLSLVDVTEHIKSEEALRNSEERYRTLVESSPDGILSLDAGGHIIDCNEGACQLIGHVRKEIEGKDAGEFLRHAGLVKLDVLYGQLMEEGHHESELELMRYDGQHIPVWAKTVAIYDGNGDFSQSIMYLRDIADRKKLDQLKDEFIGLVSHELRSPLTVIMGAVNTVLVEGERLSSDDKRQLLRDAAWEAESLSNLLGNLLELSKAQANRLLLHTEPVSVANVGQDAIRRVIRQSSGHWFVTDIPDGLPPVNADQLRLERTLYNLLENAVKYSPEGGEIRIFAKVEGEHVVIGVSDQGIGISLHDQGKLFEPFQRLEDHRVEGIRGAGLGLLVCRRLVEAHGGRIWVESEPGQGATFFFALPLGYSTRSST